MRSSLGPSLVFAIAVVLCADSHANDDLMLCDFESLDGLKIIENRKGIELSGEHATQGKKAGKVAPGFTLNCGEWTGLPKDWSAYDQLHLDVFNPGEPGKVSLWISDAEGNDYWKRHNNEITLKSGPNTIRIAVGGLFRGEKGSGRFLDNKNIMQLLMAFPKESKEGYYLDNFRFVKGAGGTATASVLLSFEDSNEPGAKWSIEDWPEDQPGKSVSSIVEEHATNGRKALKAEFRANGGGIHVGQLADPDWSRFDSLELDCFNASEAPVKLSGWFADAEAQKTNNDYWKRHNYQTNLAPGASTLRFPVGGLYRGEKGSGKFLDPHTMVGFCITAKNVTIYFDNLRLVKGSNEIAVEGMKKFNFGPAAASTFPGFTKVQADTEYNAQRGFGWLGAHPTDAREYEQPDSLTGHFVRCNGGETFAIDTPTREGEYGVYAIIDCPEYWDHSHYSKRSIEAQGKEVTSETVTPAQYFKDIYFAHQDDEDLPGTDIWQRYVRSHFQPKTFKAHVTDGQIKLTFKGDSWGLTLSTLIVYPVAAEDAAQRFLAQLEQRRRDEFNTNYAEVVRKPDAKPEISAAEQAAGYILFSRELDKEISYNSAPGAEKSDTRDVKFVWLTTPGEYASANFAVYPLKDCGNLTVIASDLAGPNGATIPASALRARAIRYKMKRIGGRITSSYDYRPWLLADFADFAIPAGVTRRFWVTCKVPDGAAPGVYSGKLTLTLGGAPRAIPISLEVLPVKLDEPTMPIGMYGGAYPTGGTGDPTLNAEFHLDQRIEEVLRDQKEHGMTAITPPAPRFNGIKDGKAQFDFAEADRHMELLRKLGFHHPCFTYAQMFNVREGDVEAEARKQYGVSLEDAIKLAYQDLGAHAQEKNWLPMAWALADEPLIHGISVETVVKVFEAHRRAAPQMQFVSEDAMGDPQHWTVIPAIDIISANSPRYKVAEAVKKAGRKYWFNNIGTDRLTFGWFLWKAHAKMGVEALFQWGYSTNTGDIYYDLDGSEGDSGVSFTASEGQRARREWEMVREGMNDHRYLQTLFNLIAKAEANGSMAAKAKAAEAKSFCESTMEKIDLEKKSSPYSNSDFDAFKRKLAAYILDLR